jgi:ABC-2 type transport system ATP-binding protein
MRLQVKLVPRGETPVLPAFVQDHTRVRNTLIAVVAEAEAAHGIGWAQELMGMGVAEEYSLGATTLEDAYIRLTGDLEARETAAP